MQCPYGKLLQMQNPYCKLLQMQHPYGKCIVLMANAQSIVLIANYGKYSIFIANIASLLQIIAKVASLWQIIANTASLLQMQHPCCKCSILITNYWIYSSTLIANYCQNSIINVNAASFINTKLISVPFILFLNENFISRFLRNYPLGIQIRFLLVETPLKLYFWSWVLAAPLYV